MKNTEELEHELKSATNILDYLERNTHEMLQYSLTTYLNEWLAEKGLTKADVVRGSNLTRAYVYQIWSGRKHPSRDKVIALAFGLGLNADEAQTLLKQAGYGQLYPREPRDALLLFALQQRMDIIQANDLLDDHHIEALE